MKRILAHKVIYQGRSYELSVVTFDDTGRVISIAPFHHETPSTTFHPGTLNLDKDREKGEEE